MMKKRTDYEKLQMVNDACDLLNEGIKAIRQAKQMLHVCGIDICNYIDAEDVQEWNGSGSNIQIYRGIPNMEKIIGEKAYFPNDCITEKIDKSRKKLKYRGLVFLQIAKVELSKFSYR